MGNKVLLAMSGGVDSSVCAQLLIDQGYEVIGVFMRTGVHGSEDARAERKKGCCSALDAGDARRVADKFDIPFYALDFEAEFGKIMDYFAHEYLSGRTPNPCIVCNNWLKFGQLWSYGEMLGVDHIATGHYAKIVHGTDGAELHRAVDPDKDQSYVLHGLKRKILEKIMFPLGDMKKEQVRELAFAANLSVADKPDSVEICFVPDGDHAKMIKQRMPDLNRLGMIVDEAGKSLATHDGIERFTIGQRKGLGFATGQRKYVLKIVAEENKVVVGEMEGLLAKGLKSTGVNWQANMPMNVQINCQAQIRYRHKAAPAKVIRLGEEAAEVEFETSQSAVTPGQAVVFYDGNRVLGGGWIDEAL